MKKFNFLFALCAAFAAAMFATCLDPNFENPFDSKNLDDNSGGVTQDVIFYCPDECEAEQGASRPSGCFETQNECRRSITSNCTAGVDCDDDEGYCNDNCTLIERSNCNGTFSQIQPASCDINIGSCTTNRECANNINRANCLVGVFESMATCPQPTAEHFNPDITYGSFIDSRDNRRYFSVTIGTQTWMAENLRFETSSGSGCYKVRVDDDAESNCNIYGPLYEWATAMALPEDCNSNSCANHIQIRHRGICPSGWHLPSNDEWITLIDYVNDDEFIPGWLRAGTKLKSSIGWQFSTTTPIGTNDFGFSALPGGGYAVYGDGANVQGFGRLPGSSGYWWTATESNESSAVYQGMTTSELMMDGWISKSLRFSVRCVRD